MVNRFGFAHRFVVALTCTCIGVVVWAQTPPVQKPYEPAVGQPGKDVMWVPTTSHLVNKMLDLGKVTVNDYVIDLGSGDGRLVIAAAQRGARALGVEYNPEMVELAKANAEQAGVGARASFVKADIFETDFSQATVITMFLLPSLNLRLRPKILDLKPGTRIVSNTFDMAEWTADETVAVAEEGVPEVETYSYSYRTALLWVVPAKVAGTWQSQTGELELTQHFQRIEGVWKGAGSALAISDGRLSGDQIRFRVGLTDYFGQVSDNVIRGSVSAVGQEAMPWIATRRTPQ